MNGPEDITLIVVLVSMVIGFVAGVLGGLAGIGGSLVMIPGLVLVLGYDEGHTAHHVYMAAAMVVNVLVSAPAAWRHRRAGAVRRDLLAVILPTMSVAIILGVLISTRIDGEWLKFLLAAFIVAYCTTNLGRFFRRAAEPTGSDERAPRPFLGAIGAGTGLVGGLLGIGGGIVLVPLLQLVCRVNLRQSIGTSSAVMAVTAVIGSAAKVLTLDDVGRHPGEALMLAAAMGPTAVAGGLVGAKLTHSLPLQVVRLVISVLLLAAAARMAAS